MKKTVEEREAHIRWEQDFYAKCSEILNIDHEYHVPFHKKTRWSNRVLGNGRYEGFGVIQVFNKQLFHIMSSKHGVHMFYNEDDVYDFLERIIA